MRIKTSENLRTLLITLASLATIGVINISIAVASVKASQKIQVIFNSREINLPIYLKTTIKNIKKDALEEIKSSTMSSRINDYREIHFNLED